MDEAEVQSAKMCKAIYRCDPHTVRQLLREGADPNWKFGYPLKLIMRRLGEPVTSDERLTRYVKIFEALIDNGADLNIMSGQRIIGCTEPRIVSILARKPPEAFVFWDEFVAHAVEHGHSEVVRVLRRVGKIRDADDGGDSGDSGDRGDSRGDDSSSDESEER